MTPFLSFYTPTFRRPKGLAACLASVQAQTVVDQIEQIVIPDHIGIGIGGMFAKVQDYASAVHGQYVHMLCDDDVLADPTVVAQVQSCAQAYNNPPVILVSVNKGGNEWPAGEPWPPQMGLIDLGCLIVRRDAWQAHAQDYKPVYEGDYWFANALFNAGHGAAWCDVLFLNGAVSRGAQEMVA